MTIRQPTTAVIAALVCLVPALYLGSYFLLSETVPSPPTHVRRVFRFSELKTLAVFYPIAFAEAKVRRQGVMLGISRPGREVHMQYYFHP